MITQEELKERYKYCSKTGVFTRAKDIRSYKKGTIAGTKTNNGYIRIKIGGKPYMAHRLAWLYAHGEMPCGEIDHINHNRADNSISNLRIVLHKDNMKNRRRHKDNTSGTTGVFWRKRDSRWVATIKVNNKSKHLGYHKEFSDALAARKAAEIKYGFHTNHGG